MSAIRRHSDRKRSPESRAASRARRAERAERERRVNAAERAYLFILTGRNTDGTL